MAQPNSTNQSSSRISPSQLSNPNPKKIDHVAQELRKHFPEVENVLNANKVKSKLSQGFKKDYDTFLACKDASRFGWDKISCEVTASDAVWDKFLLMSLDLGMPRQTNKSEAQRSASQPSSSNADDKKTSIQQAMALYQEVHAPHSSNEDSLAAFKIFRNDINAQIFTSITNDGLRTTWLQEQIQESTQ
ncbi:uncharacterized protein VP01_24g10 [Puccinia sorghi]|uniref:Myb/SANT-like domain-containing protein n=1 Tax=Puccinia sorghi TaxID=27349 RepID=A0A0L6V5U4_9BASI|nr:uncharacterized protein VP01_24g10 [Puccinia sorghi]